jgi:hypothetical protein
MAQLLRLVNEKTSFSAIAAETFEMGAAVAVKSDGLLYKACAGTSNVVPCMGFAETAGVVDKSAVVKNAGFMKFLDGGLVKGGYVYLGETAGTVQTHAPPYTDMAIQIVGVAVDTERFLIALDEWTAAVGSPSASPSVSPSKSPSVSPSKSPSVSPSASSSQSPSVSPSISVSVSPSASASISPSVSPSASPSLSPSGSASISPSVSPSASPSLSPSGSASISPSVSPSISPSVSPSMSPS